MRITVVVLCLSICMCAGAFAAGPRPLRWVQTIPLEGVRGRIDHMAYDRLGQRLFIAALGNRTVEVDELASARRVKSLRGFHEPPGLGFVSSPPGLFVANGGDGMCDILDGKFGVSALTQARGARHMKATLIAVALIFSGVGVRSVAHAAGGQLEPARIEELTGAKGKLDEQEKVFKVSVPRGDLDVKAAGVRMTPPMGLTSWAAFKHVGQHTVVMGDLVLLEDQVNPVMTTALDNGLEVTALHNHFFWDTPKVMFMHIAGMGDEATLAASVGKVFGKIKETSSGKGEIPHADIDPTKTSLDPAKIEAILHVKGDLKDGVYKVVVGRTTRMHGEVMGSTMGVNTWAAFAGSDVRAVVDGDFAMLESEVQPVLKALRGAGINIVAIHQHMTVESPRIIFLHYWGMGATEGLARGLRAALDRTAVERAAH